MGLLAYLMALVATVPAARALAYADTDVAASGVQGTVWSGAAQRADFGGPLPVSELHWDTRLWPLFTGELAADAQFTVAGARVDGRFARQADGALVARDANIRGPANALLQLVQAPALSVEGEVLGRIQQATVRAGQVRMLTGRFQWDGATLVDPLRIALGTVRGRIRPVEDNMHEIELESSGGDVASEGVVRLFANGRYEIELTMNPTRDAPDHVADTLSMLARRNDNGDFVLRQSGQL
ncbi:MAG: type II secretion system protein N, partial [Halofilum sp. (in: g-proteobacteria)]